MGGTARERSCRPLRQAERRRYLAVRSGANQHRFRQHLFRDHANDRMRRSLGDGDLARAFGMVHKSWEEVTQYDDFAASGFRSVEDIARVFRSSCISDASPTTR